MSMPIRVPSTPWTERLVLAGLGLAFTLRYPVHFAAGNPFLMDFNVYHLAAQQLAAGNGAALYDVFAGSEAMYFKYAPVWAVLWRPLAAFTPLAGAVLWTALSVAWLVLSCWLSGRLVRRAGLPYPAWVPCLAVITLVRPLMNLFGNGQVDLWWGALALFFLAGELTRRPWAAALALALSIALKLPSALFLPYLAMTGRRASALRTLACLAVVLALGGLAVEPARPWHPLVAWWQRLAALGPASLFMIGDQSLMALCARLLTADGYGLNIASLSRPTVMLVACLLNAALFAAVVRPRRDAGTDARLIWDTALLMILMTLASPSAWLATYTTLIFPLCLALAAAVQAVRARRLFVPTAVLGTAIAALSVATHSSFWKAVGLRYWRTESYIFLVFMVITLMALALFAALRRLRPAAGAPPGTSRS